MKIEASVTMVIGWFLDAKRKSSCLEPSVRVLIPTPSLGGLMSLQKFLISLSAVSSFVKLEKISYY